MKGYSMLNYFQKFKALSKAVCLQLLQKFRRMTKPWLWWMLLTQPGVAQGNEGLVLG